MSAVRLFARPALNHLPRTFDVVLERGILQTIWINLPCVIFQNTWDPEMFSSITLWWLIISNGIRVNFFYSISWFDTFAHHGHICRICEDTFVFPGLHIPSCHRKIHRLIRRESSTVTYRCISTFFFLSYHSSVGDCCPETDWIFCECFVEFGA